MRIAIVAPQFPEYSLRYASEMSSHCPVLLCVDERQLAAEYLGRKPDFRSLTQLHMMHFKNAWDLVKLVYCLARFRPTIVHLQEAVGPRRRFFNACVVAVFKQSTTVVLTIHDPLPHSGRDQTVAARGAAAQRYTRKRADVIIVHGEHCARQYRDSETLRAQQRLLVSRHGAILEPPVKKPPPPYPFQMYFFGRMEPYKGLGTLLAAAQQLHDANVAFRLVIEGHGPELDRLGPRFATLPEVSILPGFVPPGRVMDAIQQSHCVVLPYLDATQSGVLAAALTGHRCVIASDVGGLRDVVEDGVNGLLVPPNDPTALKRAVQRLIDDQGLWQRLQRGATETACNQLNWSAIADHVYDNLALMQKARQPSDLRPHSKIEAGHDRASRQGW
jgi:glycosyltransferase involved in cell wall biosynthesis